MSISTIISIYVYFCIMSVSTIISIYVYFYYNINLCLFLLQYQFMSIFTIISIYVCFYYNINLCLFQYAVTYKLSIALFWMGFHFTLKPLFPEILNSGKYRNIQIMLPGFLISTIILIFPYYYHQICFSLSFCKEKVARLLLLLLLSCKKL